LAVFFVKIKRGGEGVKLKLLLAGLIVAGATVGGLYAVENFLLADREEPVSGEAENGDHAAVSTPEAVYIPPPPSDSSRRPSIDPDEPIAEGTASDKSYSVVFEDRAAGLRFETFPAALRHAKDNGAREIIFTGTNIILWEDKPLGESARIRNVPLINQNPELPRGCEVTALAMLINFRGIAADKMDLAEEIAKDPTPAAWVDGRKHFGNPNTGFVGDMYSLGSGANDGLGVYHGPIYDLLLNYFPDTAVDLTGIEFADMLSFVERGNPVWIIITSRFRPLYASDFEVWDTPAGEISVTYRMHSVLITGFDENYIYFNDPWGVEEVRGRTEFAAAWVQMGRQAVTAAGR
jgi:uncharacterized protein YvpB